ncbi:hypothetical protein J2Z75_005072 [Rhizobium herbae]|uniref:Uncharacterized protein n=1 Tax=Rhizobium herbae TaxID=508661 RepID=A0ABS4EUD6_9HYPH|nr:hypothetical protein [Rhizobium herbae]
MTQRLEWSPGSPAFTSGNGNSEFDYAARLVE